MFNEGKWLQVAELDVEGRRTLTDMAHAMVSGRKSATYNFKALSQKLAAGKHDEVINFLRTRVAQLSENTLIVRRAERGLFHDSTDEVNALYLVVYEEKLLTSEEQRVTATVRELREGMRLVVIEPLEDDFEVGAAPATPEEYRHYRRELFDRQLRELITFGLYGKTLANPEAHRLYLELVQEERRRDPTLQTPVLSWEGITDLSLLLDLEPEDLIVRNKQTSHKRRSSKPGSERGRRS